MGARGPSTGSGRTGAGTSGSDDGGRAGCATPLPAPHQPWVPAFAGTTRGGAGPFDRLRANGGGSRGAPSAPPGAPALGSGFRRNDDGGAGPFDGLRANGGPRPPAPHRPWVPAFAGTTMRGAGPFDGLRANGAGGARTVPCDASLHLTCPGFRLSPERPRIEYGAGSPPLAVGLLVQGGGFY